ncbi:hypothetical protein GCM10009531_85580 [Actinoplanes capillaceus]
MLPAIAAAPLRGLPLGQVVTADGKPAGCWQACQRAFRAISGPVNEINKGRERARAGTQ